MGETSTNCDDSPSLMDVLHLSAGEFPSLMDRHNISTIYLPVDGTRRYFMGKTGIDYKDPEFFSKYFEFSQLEMVNLLQRVFDIGFKTVIVLLMDKSAFSRGSTYLEHAIELGIQPLLTGDKFLSLYKNYQINLGFAGFNYLYASHGFEQISQQIRQVNDRYDKSGEANLYFYTGPSSPSDIFSLVDPSGLTPSETYQEVFHQLYPFPISLIDLSLFYGHPRDKISPMFLDGDSVNFYSSIPSLGITTSQLKKSVYHTIQSQASIGDNYLQYQYANPSGIDLGSEELLGESWYAKF